MLRSKICRGCTTILSAISSNKSEATEAEIHPKQDEMMILGQ
jgi:hypothetical protein